MASYTLKPVTCRIPPVTGENGFHSNVFKVSLGKKKALPAPLEMKEKEQPVLQESSAVSSRREMMHLTAASLCFGTLFSSAPAEARPRNAPARQKIMEKLDELKEKAGLSKERVGSKVDELKEKAGSSKARIGSKVDELKEKAGSSKQRGEGKVDELREKAGLPKPRDKVDELREKAGLPKPRDESKLNKSDDEAKLLKPVNGTSGTKLKLKDDTEGANHGNTSRKL